MSRGVVRLLVGIIRAYQVGVSPFLGNTCRFLPSCSHYAIRALDEHGLRRGVGLVGARLGRCHPFHPGGVDPVPGRGGDG